MSRDHDVEQLPRRGSPFKPYGGEAGRPSHAAPLGQHAMGSADSESQDDAVRAASPCSRSLRARSFTTSPETAGILGGRAGRGENGKTCRKLSEHSSTISRDRSNIASVSVGKTGDDVCAEDDLRSQALDLSTKGEASAREWRRFMRFRTMSSPDCRDRWRCGISGLVASASIRSRSASMESIEESRSRLSSGTCLRTF